MASYTELYGVAKAIASEVDLQDSDWRSDVPYRIARALVPIFPRDHVYRPLDFLVLFEECVDARRAIPFEEWTR